jgi:hypothetical protein
MASKPGRNERCPCGSGIKYKRCCRDSAVSGQGFTKADAQSAHAKVVGFLHGPGWREVIANAREAFWGACAPGMRNENYLTSISRDTLEHFLFYDFPVEPGKYVVDYFLETAKGAITPQERQYLRTMSRTMMRVYEVTETRPGQLIVLRDLWNDEIIRIRQDFMNSWGNFRRWTWIAARLMRRGPSGKPEIGVGALPFSPIMMQRDRESLLEDIDFMLKSLSVSTPRTSERERWALVLPIIHGAWCDSMNPARFFYNEDGEQIQRATVRFDVMDEERLAAALDSSPALVRVPGSDATDTITWAWREPTRRDDEKPSTKGILTLRGHLLVLNVGSLPRAERSGDLITQLAGDLVRRRGTTTESVATSVLERPWWDREHPFDFSDATWDANEEKLIEYYERWIDEGLEALDGCTPRQAAAHSPAMRARLIRVVKKLESSYEGELAFGLPTFDPSWIREEIGLDDAEFTSGREHRATPVPAHNSSVEPMPELVTTARAVAERLRRERGDDSESTVSRAQLADDLTVRAFVRDHAKSITNDPSAEDASAEDECFAWLGCLCDFELYRRRTFRVEESLSWMLGATELDLTGDDLQVPFPSFAITFTDRYVLGLAERTLSRERARLRGRILGSVTAYVSQGVRGDIRHLRISLACDSHDGQFPCLLVRELVLRSGATLEEILDSHVPGTSNPLEPVFVGSPIRRLVQLVFNVILYTSSIRPSLAPSTGKPRSPAMEQPQEHVYKLGGTIDIGSLAQLKKLRRASGKRRTIMQRTMVRGHWRRAHADWKDQRPRWIAPHWRGPADGAIVDKNYRLEP